MVGWGISKYDYYVFRLYIYINNKYVCLFILKNLLICVYIFEYIQIWNIVKKYNKIFVIYFWLGFEVEIEGL